jgi:hypothetical protein
MYSFLLPAMTPSGERPLAAVHADDKRRLHSLRRSQSLDPGRLRFQTTSRLAERDWLEADIWGAWLCSERVRALLLEEQVAAHVFPVALRFRRQGRRREEPRFLVMFEPLADLVSLDRSGAAPSSAGGDARGRVVLTAQALQQQPPLFLGRPLIQLLVHERLRARLEAADIVGLAFAELSMAHAPSWGGSELAGVSAGATGG